MKFVLVIVFVAGTLAGLHFSGIVNKFQESDSPKKVRAVKPESIRKKLKEPPPKKPVYTFFETLNDSTMTQYVDLNGRLTQTSLSPGKKAPAKAKAKVATHPVNKEAKLKPATKPEKRKESNSVSKASEITEQGDFVVQVSSFRDKARAESLRSRLQKSGFDAFLTQTELAGQGGTWHRVFLGRYVDEHKAQAAANLAKSKYKLNVVVRNTD